MENQQILEQMTQAGQALLQQEAQAQAAAVAALDAWRAEQNARMLDCVAGELALTEAELAALTPTVDYDGDYGPTVVLHAHGRALRLPIRGAAAYPKDAVNVIFTIHERFSVGIESRADLLRWLAYAAEHAATLDAETQPAPPTAPPPPPICPMSHMPVGCVEHRCAWWVETEIGFSCAAVALVIALEGLHD